MGGHVRLAGYGGRDGGEHPGHAATHPVDHGAGRLRGRTGHVIQQAVDVPEGAQVGVGDAAVMHQLDEDGGQTLAAMMTVVPVHGGGGYGMTCGAGQGLCRAGAVASGEVCRGRSPGRDDCGPGGERDSMMVSSGRVDGAGFKPAPTVRFNV